MKIDEQERQRQADILRRHTNAKLKRRNAGIRATETKLSQSEDELSREGQMAAWSKAHGKGRDDNPHRRLPTDEEQRSAERRAELARLAALVKQ